MFEYEADGKIYAFYQSDLTVCVWDDASFPEPGMPDHIYEMGTPANFSAALSKIRALVA